MSFDRLIEKIIEMKNPTVVGLDPKLEYVPEFIRRRYLEQDGLTLKAAAKAIYDFNQAIIDEIHDIVPAIKPQAAYYEMYGHYGIRTLEKTIRYAKLNGMFVITDGKRTYCNPTGNPGMAVGGSGDVLAGIIVSLLGQGIAPLEAAACGAWLHGAAGDLCAREIGQYGMLPTDMVTVLPRLLK